METLTVKICRPNPEANAELLEPTLAAVGTFDLPSRLAPEEDAFVEGEKQVFFEGEWLTVVDRGDLGLRAVTGTQLGA